MAITNKTTLNDLIGTIVSTEAQSAAISFRVMRPLVNARECPQGAGSIVIPRFQAIAVAGLTEGTAPTATAWSTDGVTLTPVERGVLVTISKSAMWADPWGDLAPYGEQLGRTLAQDEDAVILALVDNLTTSIVNEQTTTPANIDSADLLTAIGLLEAQNAPPPYFGVFHPISWAKIRAGIDDAAVFASVGQQIVTGFGAGYTQSAGFVGAPYGVPCFMSTQVDATLDTAATYSNVVASKQAFGYAWTYDIRVDIDENIPARAFDAMAWYSGHAATLVDAYAVNVQDDING
jgi:hypothetical protein